MMVSFVNITSLSVSNKIFSAFGGAFLAVLIMCLTVFIHQQSSIDAAQINTLSNQVVDDIDRIQGSLLDQISATRGVVLFKSSRYTDRYKTLTKSIEDTLVDARKDAAGNSNVLAEIDSIARSAHTWQEEIGNRIISLGSDAATLNDATALAVSERSVTLGLQFRDAITSARAKINAWSDQAQVAQDSANAAVRTALIIGALTSLAIMLAAWYWLGRVIASPSSP